MPTIYYISIFSASIPILLGFINYRILPYTFKVLLFLLTYGFITDIILEITASKKINNLIFINLHTVIEFFLLCYFFYLLETNNFLKKGLIVTSSILGGILIYNLFRPESHGKLNIIILESHYVYFIIVIILFFIQLIKKFPIPESIFLPLFSVLLAYLLKFAGTVLIMISYAILPAEEAETIYPVIWIAGIIFHILMTVAFLTASKNKEYGLN